MNHIIIVHGFMYDPADHGGNNDPAPFFARIRQVTNRHDAEGWAWYSVPFGVRPSCPVKSAVQTARAWAQSWAHLHLHPYRLAWDLAETQAHALARAIVTRGARGQRVDLIAHSLGARVALGALPYCKGIVDRVVLLNGAELQPRARLAHAHTGAKVLNLASRSDDVLRLLGSRFSGDRNAPCIGQAGLGAFQPHWHDLVLDDMTTRMRALACRGWDLRGDNPASFWDHWYIAHHMGNRDLIRAFLGGDPLTDILASGAEAA